MAKVFIEESTLQAIGDAIRSKTDETMPINVVDMANAISNIVTDAGGDTIPSSAFLVSGNCPYRFSHNGWNWFIEQYGDKVVTSDITAAGYMFSNSNQLTQIPFDLNFLSTGSTGVDNMFVSCFQLESIGKIKNLRPNGMSNMFSGCYKLRYLPEFENLNMEVIYTGSYSTLSYIFQNCHSLREIPESLLKQIRAPLTNSTYNLHFSNMFTNCYALDEIRGVSPVTATVTSNAFTNTFNACSRAKDIIFDTQEDGTPYIANWKNQTIDLTKYVGYMQESYENRLTTGYNSGITADKKVTNDATYQALKNDPDWYTLLPDYSRYNHDSAVNTINSLPDTSAYLATQSSGTNSIRFTGASGANTDGGAINTLTADEVAIANAKGWTVYVDGVVFTGI